MNAHAARWRPERLLGLPGWYAPSAVEAVSSLWFPRFEVEAAQIVAEALGAPRRIDMALGFSGRGHCLAEYEGTKLTKLMSFNMRDFMLLWYGDRDTVGGLAPWAESAESTMWVENTSAKVRIVDEWSNVVEIGQRNGRVLMRMVKAAVPAAKAA